MSVSVRTNGERWLVTFDVDQRTAYRAMRLSTVHKKESELEEALADAISILAIPLEIRDVATAINETEGGAS